MLTPLFPDLASLPRPSLDTLPLDDENLHAVHFTFDTYRVRFVPIDSTNKRLDDQLYDGDSCRIEFVRDGRVAHAFIFGNSSFFLHPLDAYAIDLDGNGHRDLCIVWSPNPSTGIGSNAPRIEAFLQSADDSFRRRQYSSFYGDVDLFRDYDRDGRLDFACIGYDPVRDTTGRCGRTMSVNLFSFRDGELVNISGEVTGFPALLCEIETGMRNEVRYDRLSDTMHAGSDRLSLDRPNVWDRNE